MLIQGECEISLLKERTSAEYQAALGHVSPETKRIILLMKNPLSSHGDKEILKNARETVLLADFPMQFVGNRVRFTTDHFAFAIEANPHLLKIAIGNILNNACKYSGEAPVEMQLKKFVLTITDMGIGILEEEIARVYQPFIVPPTHGVRRAWYRT
ncbi:MAG: sensor histidine kinase [Parabacteroides merdae]